MIPVYAHRYLPAGRGTYGHPVLSIYQTDIIIYGTDLADYIDREFGSAERLISADWTPPPHGPLLERIPLTKGLGAYRGRVVFFAFGGAPRYFGTPDLAPGVRVQFDPDKVFAARERNTGRQADRTLVGDEGLSLTRSRPMSSSAAQPVARGRA